MLPSSHLSAFAVPVRQLLCSVSGSVICVRCMLLLLLLLLCMFVRWMVSKMAADAAIWLSVQSSVERLMVCQ